MILRAAALAVLTLSLARPGAIAQSGEHRPEFEVASIKPSSPGEQGVIQWPPGRFSASKTTVMNLINYAFEIPEPQVTGAPGWLTSERFDISALSGDRIERDPNAKLHPTQLMLQALLEERFSLKYHHETQERPVYALVVAKNGPKLEPNSGKPFEIIRHGRRQIICQRVTMERFARALSSQLRSEELGRPVVDRTAITGEFDFILEWAPEIVSQGRRFKSSQDLGGPSVFTAVRQLGLRLQAEKGPVDILVIDHVGKPSEN
jgi:uncharacterized protein (TIGR03435 family)